ALNSDNKEVYLHLGKLQFADKKFTEANTHLEKAITLGLNNEEVFTLRGEARAQLNRTDEALEDLTRALAIRKDYIPAMRARARIRFARNDYAGVAADLAVVASRNEAQPDDYAMLGIARYELKDYKTAVTDLTKAAEMPDVAARVFVARGKSYLELKEFEKAVADLTKAIEKGDKQGSNYAARGNAYFNLKEYARALPDLE
ncbi:MAG: tetratricopeptide repeat protein, partial [Cyclobacteriaceae bacterium]|nr:tetratricopeptide repeat protein [Cyclobacteriaceae bacterium]